MSGNTNTTTNYSTSTLPAPIANGLQTAVDRSVANSNAPNPMQGIRQPVAPWNPGQQAASDGAQGVMGYNAPNVSTGYQPMMLDTNYQPMSLQAGDVTRYGQPSINGSDIQAMQNPYTQQVVQTSLDELNRQLAQTNQATAGQAASAGAFGGDRAAIMQAENGRNANQIAAQMISNLNNQGWQSAAGLAGQNADRELKAGTAQGTLDANVGEANQYAGIQGANLNGMQGRSNQAAVGTNNALNATNERSNQQAGLGAAGLRLNASGQLMSDYGTFNQLQQKDLDSWYQAANRDQMWPIAQNNNLVANMSSLMSGVPRTTVSQQTSPGPSAVSQVAGLGTAALGLNQLVPGGIGNAVKGLFSSGSDGTAGTNIGDQVSSPFNADALSPSGGFDPGFGDSFFPAAQGGMVGYARGGTTGGDDDDEFYVRADTGYLHNRFGDPAPQPQPPPWDYPHRVSPIGVAPQPPPDAATVPQAGLVPSRVVGDSATTPAAAPPAEPYAPSGGTAPAMVRSAITGIEVPTDPDYPTTPSPTFGAQQQRDDGTALLQSAVRGFTEQVRNGTDPVEAIRQQATQAARERSWQQDQRDAFEGKLRTALGFPAATPQAGVAATAGPQQAQVAGLGQVDPDADLPIDTSAPPLDPNLTPAQKIQQSANRDGANLPPAPDTARQAGLGPSRIDRSADPSAATPASYSGPAPQPQEQAGLGGGNTTTTPAANDDWSHNKLGMGLLAAGFGMMASKSHSALGGIGEGALAGLHQVNDMTKEQNVQELKKATLASTDLYRKGLVTNGQDRNANTSDHNRIIEDHNKANEDIARQKAENMAPVLDARTKALEALAEKNHNFLSRAQYEFNMSKDMVDSGQAQDMPQAYAILHNHLARNQQVTERLRQNDERLALQRKQSDDNNYWKGVQSQTHIDDALARAAQEQQRIAGTLGKEMSPQAAVAAALAARTGTAGQAQPPAPTVAPPAAAPAGPQQIRTKEQYDKLAPGTPYIAPNGQHLIKKSTGGY